MQIIGNGDFRIGNIIHYSSYKPKILSRELLVDLPSVSPVWTCDVTTVIPHLCPPLTPVSPKREVEDWGKGLFWNHMVK